MDMRRWWPAGWRRGAEGAKETRPQETESSRTAQALIREIHDAHQDWVNAQRHFEYAVGQDQIDYAIFAIEAAEKRYEMLLRQAKKMPVAWAAERRRAADAG